VGWSWGHWGVTEKERWDNLGNWLLALLLPISTLADFALNGGGANEGATEKPEQGSWLQLCKTDWWRGGWESEGKKMEEKKRNIKETLKRI